jgi:hypothetical protein
MNEIEKAIKIIYRWRNEAFNKEEHDLGNLAILALKKQLNNGWTLTTEKLPEYSGKFLVQTKRGTIKIATFRILVSLIESYKTKREWVNCGEVIAWQPLPEAFKGVE